MGEVVVAWAQQAGVDGVGVTSAGPGRRVMHVTQVCRGLAAGVLAVAVLHDDGAPLGRGVKAALAAEVQDVGIGAEHGGDDAGLAGQAAGLAGGDAVPGVQRGGAQPAKQGIQAHRDHDGGVVAPGLGKLVGG